MKLNTVACGITLGLLSLTSQVEAVQLEATDKVYVGVFGEHYWADWNNVDPSDTLDLGESFGGGIELGYNFSDYWTARLEYTLHHFNIENNNDHSKAERFGIDALYHFDDSSIYAIAGLKRMEAYQSFNMVNLGLGMRHFVTDNVAFSGEINLYEGLNENHTDVGVKLGVNYFFGEASPAVKKEVEPATVSQVAAPAAPIDTDNDGVYDVADNCVNSEVAYAVDLKGCTVYEEKEVSVRLLVNFNNDKSDVNSQYLSDIKKVADFLNTFKKSTVKLEGHTSSQGNAAYNHKLSEQRAKAVGDVLVSQYQIDRTRVSTVGFGETRLINKANTDTAHAQNRRVVAAISTVKRLPVKR
ncbi:OmpA family protein [Pseudoalteromonas sp. C2R02]|uniref:OmpA family protein n=1 Tax=Pseudoalteromonas sp. C2R02 TaxID=2841565 RepID=UPI001C097B47|nr:OmpA family protein [Pseudoalteromonas sp. C2R02]MBU2969488.1 OmpA family protein [Pseudoalteromonas sp. C2R02]